MSQRYVIKHGVIPPGFRDRFSKFVEAVQERLQFLAPEGTPELQIGGEEPRSNIGLWLKDGTKLYVWDTVAKAYAPADFSASLPELAALSEVYRQDDFLALFADGTSVADGVYVDADKVVNFKTYAVRISPQASQAIPTTDTATMLIGNATVDLEGIFDANTFKISVPKTGVYRVSAYARFDNNDSPLNGNSATMRIRLEAEASASGVVAGHETAVASPPNDRWFCYFEDLVYITGGETFWFNARAIDGVGTGFVLVGTESSFTFELVDEI